jgi:hypothetical protein
VISSHDFEARLASCQIDPARFINASNKNPWESWDEIGDAPGDEELTRLADLYLEASSHQRQVMRQSLCELSDDCTTFRWTLLVYVRRVGMMFKSPGDAIWLERGLSIASLEDAGLDYRDTIVSLVLLRYAAEQTGLDVRQFFSQAIETYAENLTGCLTNALHHGPLNTWKLICSYGPPDWAKSASQRLKSERPRP